MVSLKRWLKGITALLFGTLLSIGRAQAAPIVIPGTSVSLDPPPGFTVAENFSGLENSQNGSSITINELPLEAYEQISTIFSTEETATEALLRQGIAIEEYTVLDVGEAQVPLLRGTQQAAGGAVTKYLTLFKGEATILVTFNIIDPDEVTQDIVETTVASITLSAAPTIDDKISQLPFSFQTVDPFEVSEVIGGSAALLSTEKGPDPTGLKPIVIITRGQNVIYSQNAAEISEGLLRGTRGFSLAEIVREEPVDFAGGSGYFIEAKMDEITVMQYAHVPENGRYIRLLATGERSRLAGLFFIIEEIASSVIVED
ncbi:MAG: hypothetical protein F6K11_24770 [Leptolyngbya sp. SIO3F4]|nr:hypothetical protein [Leptolyngbya sp. SIO3F4]